MPPAAHLGARHLDGKLGLAGLQEELQLLALLEHRVAGLRRREAGEVSHTLLGAALPLPSPGAQATKLSAVRPCRHARQRSVGRQPTEGPKQTQRSFRMGGIKRCPPRPRAEAHWLSKCYHSTAQKARRPAGPARRTTRLMKTVSAARRASMNSDVILYFSTTFFSGSAGTITPARRGAARHGGHC